MKILNILLACALAVFIPVTAAIAKEITAPDTTQPGPYQVASGEYHFPASVDPDVLAGIPTEMWAKVFYPKNYDAAAGKAPLVVLLHGNHGTCGTGSHPRKDYSCEYTNTGTCPAGSVPTPNHEGYNYLAENLASWGFWVVSVNANRGITCGGFLDSAHLLDIKQMQSNCQQNQESTACNIDVPATTRLLELPVIYYPDMLEITDNGKPVR